MCPISVIYPALCHQCDLWERSCKKWLWLRRQILGLCLLCLVQQPTEREAAWDQRLVQVVFFGRQSWYIICQGRTQLGYLLSIAAWAWLNQPRNGDNNDKTGSKLGMARPHFLAACWRNAPFSWLPPFPSNLRSCHVGTSPHMAQTWHFLCDFPVQLKQPFRIMTGHTQKVNYARWAQLVNKLK